MLLPNTRKRRVLFFIAGEIPTAADVAQAAAIGTEIFRNASQVQPDEKPEDCHAVAGCIPAAYAKLPVAKAPEPVLEPVVVPAPALVAIEPEPVPEPAAVEPEAPVQDVDSEVPVQDPEPVLPVKVAKPKTRKR